MLENLRQFLSEVPILIDLINRDLAANPSHALNAEEMRGHIEDLQASVFKRLKDEKTIYAVLHFPEFELHCPICREAFLGYYWEVNNPATGKGASVSNRLLHAFILHEQTFVSEPMENVSGVKTGECRLVLDFGSIQSVLKGGAVSEAVLGELEQAKALQQQQLAAAGDFVASGGGH